MIKKPLILLALLAIGVSACSSSARTQNGPPNSGTLNPMSELAVGTIKLDGTQNAVTKEQAAQLLTMWQVYKQLIASSTAAQPEIDGLSAQIRDTMTADQHKAISGMKLAQSDIFAFMQSQGGGPSSSASGQTNKGSTNQGGGFPGGGDPGGGMPPPDMGGGMPGGGMPGGGTTSRQATGTQTANSTQGSAQSARLANANRVPSPLIEALIQYLQKVAAS
jgi:hypothetical protein